MTCTPTPSVIAPFKYEDAVFLGLLVAIQRDKELSDEIDPEGYFLLSLNYASGNLHIAKKRLHKSMYVLRDRGVLDIKLKNTSPKMYCRVKTSGLEKLASY